MNLQNIPSELTELNQWVMWRFSETEKGKFTKKPYQKSGKLAKTNDPSTWESLDKIKLHAKNFDGIGFVFKEYGGLVGIDLDKCVTNGVIEAWALEIIKTFESYTEFSVSKKGIHIIFKGKMPDNSITKKEQIEIYEKGRYFCMTGNTYDGMNQVKEYKNLSEFLKSIGFIKDNGKQQYRPKQSSANLTNDQIIQLASNAKNGDKFTKLLNGDTSGYNSPSEADLAFASLLTFYTQDIGQVVSILQSTPLWDEKWEREYYQQHTIGKCIEGRTKFYKGNGVKQHTVLKKSAKEIAPQEANPTPTKTEKEVEVKSFNLTDYGNAERLVHYHGDKIRYCEPLKSWFVWDGKRWNPDNTLEILRLGKDVARRIYIEAGFCGDDEKRKQTAGYAKSSESVNKLKAMVDLARSEIEVVVSPDDLDKDGFLFNCQNGTANLKTGLIQPFTKSDNLTKISNVLFDPQAECPRWIQFMDEIFMGDKDLIKFVKYSLGYSLTNSIDEQCFFICYGKGENGKSKMQDTLRHMWGDYGQRVDASTFEDMKNTGQAREDIACLKQIRFITSIETGNEGRLAESLIKKMTGDSTIKARYLYQNSFEFEQTYKIWLATNHKPIISGTDNGIWRRIRLIPFEYEVPPEKKDSKLLDKFIAESSGIFNWILEGCLMWQSCGLDMVTPPKVKNATENYRQDMDILGNFIDEYCIIGKSNSVGVTKLHETYMAWANSRISRKSFNLKLEERGFKKERLMTGYFWIGLEINDEIT